MATETVINRPAPFVEDIGKKLSEQALGLQNVPVVTTGIGGLSQQTGETAAGFKARQDAARAFTTRQQNLSGLAPEVAPQDRLQLEAQKRAEAGLGSFEPFLQRAETEAQLASGLGTTALGQLGTAGSQLGIAGTTLGGVPLGAQSFQQAQGARQQDIQNRFGLGQAQAGLAGQQAGLAGATQGLGSFRSNLAQQQAQLGSAVQGLQGTDVTRLGQLGSINQAQKQAELDATREATRMAAFQPQEELNRFADITTGIMGGMRGTGTTTTNVPNPTPLQTALGVGSTLAGIYGAFNPRPLFG